jgi:uncharacterized protein
MSGGLPATVDPILLADQGARLSGRLSLRTMPRLRTQLLDDAGEAEIDLSFERSPRGNLRRMRGRVVARVNVTCQRCLEPMTAEIVTATDTALIRAGDQESELAPDVDALTVATTPTPVSELVEEELLLALPMVPMHAIDECPARRYVSVTDKRKTTHPFADLKGGEPENE